MTIKIIMNYYFEYYGYKFYSSKHVDDDYVHEFIEIPMNHPLVGKDLDVKTHMIRIRNVPDQFVCNDGSLYKNNVIYHNPNKNIFYTNVYYLYAGRDLEREQLLLFFVENDGKTKNCLEIVNNKVPYPKNESTFIDKFIGCKALNSNYNVGGNITIIGTK